MLQLFVCFIIFRQLVFLRKYHRDPHKKDCTCVILEFDLFFLFFSHKCVAFLKLPEKSVCCQFAHKETLYCERNICKEQNEIFAKTSVCVYCGLLNQRNGRRDSQAFGALFSLLGICPSTNL